MKTEQNWCVCTKENYKEKKEQREMEGREDEGEKEKRGWNEKGIGKQQERIDT